MKWVGDGSGVMVKDDGGEMRERRRGYSRKGYANLGGDVVKRVGSVDTKGDEDDV